MRECVVRVEAYIAPFRNAGGSKGEWCRKLTPNFALFAPCKN